MLQPFLKYLTKHLELTEEDMAFIQEKTTVQQFKKGAYLLEEGAVSNAFYFNLNGFVRLFYVQEGEEKTAYFYPEGVFISAYSSFVNQVPSRFYLQATEDTALVVISMESSVELLSYSKKFDILARIAMEEELIHHQDMIAFLLTMKPEERYQHLLEHQPEIFQKVPQIQIASYIGVKPESLSRIKKRAWRKS